MNPAAIRNEMRPSGTLRDSIAELAKRQENEAATLANLTGWDIGNIRQKIGLNSAELKTAKWYEKIWSN